MKKLEIKIAEMDPEVVKQEIEDFIINQVTKGKNKGGVIGLSGGIDSTTTAYLTKSAFDRYNKENPDKQQLTLKGAMLPSRTNSSKDLDDGIRVAEALGIEYEVVEMEPMKNAVINSLDKYLNTGNESNDNFNKGNLASELRAVVLSRIAATEYKQVIGTGNRDEDYAIGYFTKRGDGAVDCNPLGSLPKRLVRQMADYMGAAEDLVKRQATAGLWVGQTDDNELGFQLGPNDFEVYDVVEKVMNGHDQGLNNEQIQEVTNYRMQDINKIIDMHYNTEHKRNPPGIPEITLNYEVRK
ncbi:NAD(+) synthase [Nanoarchaeota archaeon]